MIERCIAYRRRVLAAAVVIVLAAPSLRAQSPPPIFAGAGVTGGIGIESADLAVVGSDVECGRFESGSGAFGAIDGRVMLPALFASGVGLDARLRIGYASSRLSAAPPTATVVRDGAGTVTLDREFRLQRSTVSAAIDLLARFAAGPFSIGAGASLGARVSSSVEQSDNILGPGASAFADGQTSRTMPSGSKQSSTIAIDPMLVAGLPVVIGERSTLQPEISMRFGLLSSMKEGTWRTIELGLGLGVLFDLTPAPSPIVPGR